MAITIYIGDVLDGLAVLPDESVDCIVTSPPYWGQRDYGVAGQLGMETTFGEHLATMVTVFRECRRILKPSGTLWVNYGDGYATHPAGADADVINARGTDNRTFRNKPFSTAGPIYGEGTFPPGRRGGGNCRDATFKSKDLMFMPTRLAIALTEDGWYCRSEIVWYKRNPMPESAIDRPTCAHEKIFLFTKNGNKKILWRARDTREWSADPDLTEVIMEGGKPKLHPSGRPVRRWRGFDYYYDADAVKTKPSPETAARYARAHSGYAPPGQEPHGGLLAPRPNAKADKQRGHGRRHQGFNDRWDAMSKAEQQAAGAALRNVWVLSTQGYSGEHFAAFPPELPERCILAGCPAGGTVLDPFGGSGTTAMVADRLQREVMLIELNPKYAALCRDRILEDAGMHAQIREVTL